MIDLSQVTGQAVRRPEIIMTTATEGEGLDELQKAVSEHQQFLLQDDQISLRRSKRWKAEVSSRLEYLLLEISKNSIENIEENQSSPPNSVANELLKKLLNKDELH